jgi:hypothetical protein
MLFVAVSVAACLNGSMSQVTPSASQGSPAIFPTSPSKGGSSPASPPVGTIEVPSPSPTPLAAQTLATVRADIESRFMDQLLSIGDGDGTVIVRLKPTATAVAEEIVGRYGSAVQVTVGFFPYPPPSSGPAGCSAPPLPAVDPGPLRAVIELASQRIIHAVSFQAKVRLTNTGSTMSTIDSGRPLSIYLFRSDRTSPVGAFPGAIGGTGVRLKLKPGQSQEILAVGGTASCDVRLGYELPDGPYVARAAVEIDETSGPGYFWSDPVPIQLTTP